MYTVPCIDTSIVDGAWSLQQMPVGVLDALCTHHDKAMIASRMIRISNHNKIVIQGVKHPVSSLVSNV